MNKRDPHYCLIFPRARNLEKLGKIAQQVLQPEKHLTFKDPTKLDDVLKDNKDLWATLRWTEGRIAVIMELPVLVNLEVTIWCIQQKLQCSLFDSDVFFGLIVDREHSYTRRLRDGIGGRRYDLTDGSFELDHDFYDPDAPRRFIEKLGTNTGGMHIAETTEATYETDVTAFLETLKKRKWRWE